MDGAFAEGFLKFCHEHKLTDTQIKAAAARASQIDPEIARELTGLVKEANPLAAIPIAARAAPLLGRALPWLWNAAKAALPHIGSGLAWGAGMEAGGRLMSPRTPTPPQQPEFQIAQFPGLQPNAPHIANLPGTYRTTTAAAKQAAPVDWRQLLTSARNWLGLPRQFAAQRLAQQALPTFAGTTAALGTYGLGSNLLSGAGSMLMGSPKPPPPISINLPPGATLQPQLPGMTLPARYGMQQVPLNDLLNGRVVTAAAKQASIPASVPISPSHAATVSLSPSRGWKPTPRQLGGPSAAKHAPIDPAAAALLAREHKTAGILEDLQTHWNRLAPEHKIMAGVGGALALGTGLNSLREEGRSTPNTLLGLGGLGAAAYGLTGGDPVGALRNIPAIDSLLGTPNPEKRPAAPAARPAPVVATPNPFANHDGSLRIHDIVRADDNTLRQAIRGLAPAQRASYLQQVQSFQPTTTQSMAANVAGIDVNAQRNRLLKLLTERSA